MILVHCRDSRHAHPHRDAGSGTPVRHKDIKTDNLLQQVYRGIAKPSRGCAEMSKDNQACRYAALNFGQVTSLSRCGSTSEECPGRGKELQCACWR